MNKDTEIFIVIGKCVRFFSYTKTLWEKSDIPGEERSEPFGLIAVKTDTLEFFIK